MLPITVRELIEATDGTLVQGDINTELEGVTVDSRRVSLGDVFVAFVGKNHDGHQFVPEALRRGASAVLVTRDVDISCVDGIVIRVDDSLRAVQQLACFERSRFDGLVVGVTGSNGKTTTKEMLRTVLDTGGSCLATEANQNTELGLPLTILRRERNHSSMVLEMGMRGRGQIKELCDIAKPTAGVITNIGHSHIELLGSQKEIALAKAELLQSLTLEGTAALRYEDPWLKEVAKLCKGKVLWYGFANHLDAFPSNIQSTEYGTDFDAHVLGNSAKVHLPTFGTHNVLNALSALLIGVSHDVSLMEMAERITTLPASNGRLNIINGRNSRRIIDDCFNASPASVRASLEVLKELAAKGVSVAVLGDVYELGDFSEEGHRQIGRYVAEHEIHQLITIGKMAEWIADEATLAGCHRVTHFTDVETALKSILQIIEPESTVLVKASRSMELERVVETLR